MPLLRLLWPPADKDVLRLQEESARLPLNYPGAGSTRDGEAAAFPLPEGWLWQLDNVRVKLGHGKQTYTAAKALLQKWAQFQLGWSKVDPGTPLVEGGPVVVVAKSLFLWSGNPLRIIYVHDSEKDKSHARSTHQAGSSKKGSKVARWQFGHGCVEGHLLAGEESFRLDWDPADGAVWYEVLTYSRPNHPLSLLMYPLVRFYQSKFVRDSTRTLQAVLAGGSADGKGRRPASITMALPALGAGQAASKQGVHDREGQVESAWSCFWMAASPLQLQLPAGVFHT